MTQKLKLHEYRFSTPSIFQFLLHRWQQDTSKIAATRADAQNTYMDMCERYLSNSIYAALQQSKKTTFLTSDSAVQAPMPLLSYKDSSMYVPFWLHSCPIIEMKLASLLPLRLTGLDIFGTFQGKHPLYKPR